jgi:hypothetical protein
MQDHEKQWQAILAHRKALSDLYEAFDMPKDDAYFKQREVSDIFEKGLADHLRTEHGKEAN